MNVTDSQKQRKKIVKACLHFTLHSTYVLWSEGFAVQFDEFFDSDILKVKFEPDKKPPISIFVAQIDGFFTIEYCLISTPRTSVEQKV